MAIHSPSSKPTIMATCSPVETFHILVEASCPPDSTYFPSGEKVTDSTGRECPVNVLISCPVEISHSLIVSSQPPDNAYLPSGEKVTDITTDECPVNVLISSPVTTFHSFTL